ncbi:S26 family signal peptidase [Paracoccus onubensis]|uniref:S26 family signal peptidase n=1 Tax=Paracoccus onubensis TaxID=1675788 RepID=UPI00272F2B88|nr:S26 family signal peptidase [Paracoccus onubensis]MDP0929711.1 S26 family signal peptidase [Paracoccus onubensis]
MMRAAYLAATGFALCAIGALSLLDIIPRVIWNASASVPIGIYALRPVDTLTVGDMVAVEPPDALERFITARGYAGADVPLMKHIAALPEQEVCRSGSTVTINGIEVAAALSRDSQGRALPVWQGCRVIGADEIFLLNTRVRDSLDSRYFGPLPARSVIGRAVPLWTDDHGQHRHDLHAASTSPRR